MRASGLVFVVVGLLSASSVRADTVVVPVPELIGPYTDTTSLSATFDTGFPLGEILEVRIHLVGEIVPGIAMDTMTGATFDWFAEFLASFTTPGFGLWLASIATPGAFDAEATFNGLFGATWEFLADGTGTVDLDLEPFLFIGFVTGVVPPTGTITAAELIIEFEGTGGPQFVRGDCNTDGGIDISDAIFGLAALFSSGPVFCAQACDANDDEAVDIADMIFLLDALFGSGSPPPAPHPDCGTDPTAGTLTCDDFAPCP